MNLTSEMDMHGPADFLPTQAYFDRSKKSFGPASATLAFGGLRMRLEGLGDRQSDLVLRRFGPFLQEGGSEADVTVVLRRAGVDGFLRVRADGLAESYRLGMRLEGSRLEIWSYEFAGWVNWADHRAVLAVVSSSQARFARGLENFLRVLTASFILERGGFLLHAAGIVRGGRAYVFFGPSGSGKTTVTDLSAEDTVLSDDLTLVVRRAGRYEAAGIPFGLAHHRVPSTRGSFPIASLNRLVQSPGLNRVPLMGARALAEMSASLPFVMQDGRQASKAMDNVGRALAEIPAYELLFRRDSSFWDVVQET